MHGLDLICYVTLGAACFLMIMIMMMMMSSLSPSPRCLIFVSVSSCDNEADGSYNDEATGKKVGIASSSLCSEAPGNTMHSEFIKHVL